jgi:TonB family protein
MKKSSAAAVVAILASSLSSNVGAQVQPTAQPPGSAPPTVWDLEWQDSHCTISTAAKDGVVVSLWMLPGDPDPHLYLIGPSKLLPQPTDKVTVELLPNGETFDADGYVASSRDPIVVKILHLRHKFPAAFAQSNEVRVTARGKQIAVSIPGAAKALTALRECIDLKLPEWGVDPKAYDALEVPPTDIENYEYMSSTDYPQDLLDANWTGDVITRLNVDATGKVTNCAVVVTGGHKSVDDISCFRAMQRGRFNPAIGADGKPTAAVRVRDVVFRIAQ